MALKIKVDNSVRKKGKIFGVECIRQAKTNQKKHLF